MQHRKGRHSRPLRPPSPETPWSARLHTLERSLSPPRRPVVQGNFQQYHLHSHHYDSLYEKSEVITGARPIKDLQDGCCKHDQRDIKRETSRSAISVNGKNLIGVRCNGREYETEHVRLVMKWHEVVGREDSQERGEGRDQRCDHCHHRGNAKLHKTR